MEDSSAATTKNSEIVPKTADQAANGLKEAKEIRETETRADGCERRAVRFR